jgi:hypothetical protein
MFDNEPFRRFLKKTGKKEHVIDELVRQVEYFEQHLAAERGIGLDAACSQDLLDYIGVLEKRKPGSSRNDIRALALYYKSTGNNALASLASEQREAGIAKGRSSFPLRDFLGVDPQVVQKLADFGIVNAEQMLARGATPELRAALVQEAGISEAQVLELVKLSDLSRLPGVKAIRARLYYDAGVDTVEKLAGYEPEALLKLTADFVERTHFDGIAPLPKEVQSTIETARGLPRIVRY